MKRGTPLLLLSLLFLLIACTPAPRFTSNPDDGQRSTGSVQGSGDNGGYKANQVLRGKASWYGADFHGRPTASGETFDMHGMSAAHRSLPLGTWIQVRNLANDKRVEVVVNDRGPFKSGRVLDLSYEAARRLGYLDQGVADVEFRILTLP